MNVQDFVHSFEQGKIAGFFRLVISVVAAIALALAYLLFQFRGLSTAIGIDQAQIAHEIARGNGFSTKNIRPLEAHLLQQTFGKVPVGNVPDLYHAPLNPIANAGFLYLFGSQLSQRVDNGDPVYRGDRLIAAASVLFFLLALVVNFFLAQLLFDAKVAWLATGVVLVADQFWQFSLSGLPQMLLLFFVSCSLWCLVRAVIARANDKNPFLWLLILGIFQGALALCHPITLWISGASWLFCSVYFRPRPFGALLPGLICLALFFAWIVRDLQISKTPFGISPFSLLDHVVHSESGWMRLNDPDLSEITPPAFRGRMITNLKEQLGSIYLLLGGIAVTPLFLAALFHPFKRPETNAFKWLIFLMLIGAFTGSVSIGTNAQALSPNQTLILLGPAVAIYGYAMVIVLFYRLNLEQSIYRYGVYVAFFLVTGLPTLFGFLSGGPRIQFPPYAPGTIQTIGALTKPDEIIASDMPWAMAWYADRKSLWLPSRQKDFYEYRDSESLGGPIVGLYLTPISRDSSFLSDIVSGEYKDWASIVLGLPQGLSDFPLKSSVGLMNNECLLLMDRNRWSEPSPSPPDPGPSPRASSPSSPEPSPNSPEPSPSPAAPSPSPPLPSPNPSTPGPSSTTPRRRANHSAPSKSQSKSAADKTNRAKPSPREAH
jgi:dolichyl-phosphate-mannose-protein mannosyltransferase